MGGCGLFTALKPYRLVSESAWATAGCICQMLRTHFDLLELQEVLSVQVDAEGVLWMLRSVGGRICALRISDRFILPLIIQRPAVLQMRDCSVTTLS